MRCGHWVQKRNQASPAWNAAGPGIGRLTTQGCVTRGLGDLFLVNIMWQKGRYGISKAGCWKDGAGPALVLWDHSLRWELAAVS